MMLFTIAFICGLLLFNVVLAVPTGVGTRVARRRRGFYTLPNSPLPLGTTPSSDSQQSTNWAGAVWVQPNNTFNTVTGTFTAPTPSGSTGASAAAWIGVDGYSCQSAILQTGIVFTVQSGQSSYNAWYEWYPDPPNYFTDITISAGDIIQLTVTASSSTSGTVTIENQSNGQTASQGVNSSHPLCGQNAEWIVEDYTQGASQVLLANFSSITFTDAVASGPGAGNNTPSGALVVDIYLNNQPLTSTTTNGSSVTISSV